MSLGHYEQSACKDLVEGTRQRLFTCGQRFGRAAEFGQGNDTDPLSPHQLCERHEHRPYHCHIRCFREATVDMRSEKIRPRTLCGKFFETLCGQRNVKTGSEG